MTNSKTTKRALLTSCMSILLCVAMLLGTTFAWFTDSVSSANNKIVAGNLKVDLLMADASGTYGSIANKDAAIFGAEDSLYAQNNPANTLWEPGKTQIVYLAVENKGNLDLKYNIQLNVVDGGLIGSLEYAIIDGAMYGTVNADDWASLKSTAQTGDVVAGTTVAAPNGAITVAEKTEYFALAVHMKEEAGNEYMGKDITIDVTVLATQLNAEKDSFGPDYDEYAGLPWDGTSKEDPKADADGIYHITNAAELVGMMDVTGNSIYIGEKIVLDADINLNGQTVKGIGSDVTNFAGEFDGQGHTISNFKIDATDRDYYAGLFNQVANVGIVKNLTVKGATVVGNSMVGAVASSVDGSSVIDNCKAIDCTVTGVKKVGAVVGYSAGSTVTNNYAENCTVYYSEEDAGEVLGYENTGSTVTGNTDKNVTIVRTVSTAAELKTAIENGGDVALANDLTLPNSMITIAENANINLNGKTLKVTNIINLEDGKNLTMKDGNYINDDTTAPGRINVGDNSKVEIEDVNFSYDRKKRTSGTSTNRLETVVDVAVTDANAESVIVFRNCTFNNAQIRFPINSKGEIDVTFENCTFNALTNSAPIYADSNVKGEIQIKNCTFNIEATSQYAAAIYVNSASTTVVKVTATNNTLNATKATATDSSLKGTINEIRVDGSISSISFIDLRNKNSSTATSSITETGTIKTGIAH